MTQHMVKRGGWAPGGYHHSKCATCKKVFGGDKRAWNCRTCSDALMPGEQPYEPPFQFDDALWAEEKLIAVRAIHGSYGYSTIHALKTVADVNAFIDHIRDQAKKAGIVI